MFGFLEPNTESEQYGKTVAHIAITVSIHEVGDSAERYKEVFQREGFKFEEKEFIRVCASMFSMLLLHNSRGREYIEEGEAIEMFLSEATSECVVHLDKNHSFNAPPDDPEALKTEASAWAAWKYFGKDPTTKQAALFFEKSSQFVDLIEHTDEKHFNL